jgi:hypothetical protein
MTESTNRIEEPDGFGGAVSIICFRPGPHPRPLARGPTPARRAGLRPARFFEATE